MGIDKRKKDLGKTRLNKEDTNTSQNSLFISKDSFGGVVFTSVYVFIVYWFQSVKIWPDYFFTPSTMYVPYHFFRVIFFIYLICFIYCAGSVVIRFLSNKIGIPNLTGLEMFVLQSFIGASVLQTLMFFLGIAKLYYTTTAVILTVPFVFLSFRYVRDFLNKLTKEVVPLVIKEFKKEGKTYSVVVLVLVIFTVMQVLYVFISKGLMPDLLTNDTVGGYVPYYQLVIDSHSIWMNKYWLMYYYAKGAGLFFLAGLLTDVQSTQLVSFYLFLLTVCAFLSLLKRYLFNRWFHLWSCVAVFIIFSNNQLISEYGLSVVEFQKIHITVGAYLFFIIYLSILSIHNGEEIISYKQSIAYICITCTSLIILSPVSTAFTVPCFILLFMIGMKTKESKKNIALYGAIYCLIVTSGMLIFNLFTSGMAEITPQTLFFKYRIDSILEKWISPLEIELRILCDIYTGEFTGGFIIPDLENLLNSITLSLYDPSMIPRIAYILLIILVVLISKLPGWIVPVIVILGINFIHLATSGQHSILRYVAVSGIFSKTIIYFYTLHQVQRLVDLFNEHKRNLSMFICVVTFLFALYSTYLLKPILSIEDKFLFLVGNYSYGDVYEKKWASTRLAKSIIELVGKEERILTLSPIYGLYGIPTGQFLYQVISLDVKKTEDYIPLISGDADAVKTVFLKYNIPHFLIDFKIVPLFFLYSPLFDEESLKKNFRILGRGEQLLLLTLSNKGDPMDEASVNMINQYRVAGKDFGYTRAYFEIRDKLLKHKNINKK